MFEYRLNPANFDEMLGNDGIEFDKGSIYDWYDGVTALLFRFGERSYYAINIYWDLVEYDHFKVYALFEILDCDVEPSFYRDIPDHHNQRTSRPDFLYSSNFPMIPETSWAQLPIHQLLIGGCLLSNLEKMSADLALINLKQPLIFSDPDPLIVQFITERVSIAIASSRRCE